jgi:site-specific DNA-methyltransferase (adenine-specific)
MPRVEPSQGQNARKIFQLPAAQGLETLGDSALGVNLADIWDDITPVRHSKYKRREANELSLKLLDRVIAMASDPSSLVFDPFGGSGTTFVAAEILQRRWLGSELHCADAVARLRKMEGDRNYLEKIALEKNVLFRRDALKLRRKNGHKTDRYRIQPQPATGAQQLFSLQ